MIVKEDPSKLDSMIYRKSHLMDSTSQISSEETKEVQDPSQRRGT